MYTAVHNLLNTQAGWHWELLPEVDGYGCFIALPSLPIGFSQETMCA